MLGRFLAKGLFSSSHSVCLSQVQCLVRILKSGNHAKRVTIGKKDLQLVRRIRGETILC